MIMNFLLWASGVDSDLLEKCRHRRWERQRFAMFGAIVCIPALLAWPAMTFAATTFGMNVVAAAVGGLGWALIVFILDRFLAMTLYKTSLMSAGAFWIGFSMRFLLASAIGIGLAHPMTLLLFNGPIQQRISDNARARVQDIVRRADGMKEEASRSLNQARTEQTGELAVQLDRKTKLWECKSQLVSMEEARGVAAGTVARDRDGNVCGVASGEEGCRYRCEGYKEERDQLAQEISSINDEIQRRIRFIESSGLAASASETIGIADELVRKAREADVPRDYAARSAALAEVEADHPEIRTVHLFLMFFLVLIDTLVVTLKAIAPRGEYEELRDAAIAETQVRATAHRAAVMQTAGSEYQAMVQAQMRHELQRIELSALFQAVNDVVEEMGTQFRQFQEKAGALYANIRGVKNEQDRKVFIERASDLSYCFVEAWQKALERFRAYVKGL